MCQVLYHVLGTKLDAILPRADIITFPLLESRAAQSTTTQAFQLRNKSASKSAHEMQTRNCSTQLHTSCKSEAADDGKGRTTSGIISM